MAFPPLLCPRANGCRTSASFYQNADRCQLFLIRCIGRRKELIVPIILIPMCIHLSNVICKCSKARMVIRDFYTAQSKTLCSAECAMVRMGLRLGVQFLELPVCAGAGSCPWAVFLPQVCLACELAVTCKLCPFSCTWYLWMPCSSVCALLMILVTVSLVSSRAHIYVAMWALIF